MATAKTTYAGVRLTLDEKREAEEILNDLGLSLSSYIHMMVSQLRINRAIPAVSQYPSIPSKRTMMAMEAFTNGEYDAKGQTFTTAEEAIDGLGI